MRSLVLSSRGSTMTEDRKSVVSGHSSNASVPTLTQESSGKPVTPLRKFTQGVSRPGEARQAREAVRNVMSTQNPTRGPPLAHPLDYEKFLIDKSITMDNDHQRDLLFFPRDDIEEVLVKPEHSTEVPTVSERDENEAHWLLTKEAIRFYSKDYHTICFNYHKFSGDYNNVMESSVQEDLPSLLFETDLALEEAKAKDEGFSLVDVVKEGYVLMNKMEGTLFPNPKSGKKRWCTLRRTESGDIVLEVRKQPTDEPKVVKVNSAQSRQKKKGKAIVEITIEDPDKVEKEPSKSLTLYSEDAEETNAWLHTIRMAIAFSSSKMDSISQGSNRMEQVSIKEDLDTVSTASNDSAHSRDHQLWRGKRDNASRLAPPVVERHNMFSLYYRLSPLVDTGNDKRGRWNCSPETSNSVKCLNNTLPTICAEKPHTFAVKVNGLVLTLPTSPGISQQIEPFFISIFLFDSHSGRRLSEEFHVDASGARAREVTPGAASPRSTCLALAANPRITEALYTIAQSMKDLWIVCRIDRGLHADTTGELYMKLNPDPKAVQKLQKSIQGSAIRLSSYKQRFAWTAKPIMLENCPSVDTIALPLYRCENNKLTEYDLQKYLSDFAKVEKGKMTIPNASLTISIDSTAASADYSCRINPSLLPLRPWNLKAKEPLNPIFEIQAFGDIVLEPHTELINLLYVYPLSLKYDNQKLFSKARNITCTVRFIRGHEKTDQSVINRLAPNGPLTSHASCAVQHHQQVPSFGDEIKLQLPLNLTNSDHLLFSFTHVSISGQPTAKSPDNFETPIGYAWCPLVRKKERLEMELDEQDMVLPVAAELPSGLIRSRHGLAKDDTEIRWVDQKPLFRVRLRLVSSAFTTEKRLQTFFQACQKLESRGMMGDDATDHVKMLLSNSLQRKIRARDELVQQPDETARSCSPLARYACLHADNPIVHDITKWTESLVDVPIEKLLPFLPILLSRLFAILPHAPSDVLALSTMRTILSICDRCIHAGRRSLLKTYIKLHFVISKDSAEETVYSSICRYLPAVIRGSKISKDDNELRILFPQLWFFLDVAVKSLAQTIIHRNLNKQPRKGRVSPDVIEAMGTMVESIITTIILHHRDIPDVCRPANVAVAQFIKNCLSFLDRGSVFNWIYYIVKTYDEHDSKALRDYKNTLLMILCEHEHWLSLNLPVLLNARNEIQRITSQPAHQDTSTTAGNFVTKFLNLFTTAPSSVEVFESDRYSGCTEEWWLSEAYASRHFLIGLLFQELKSSLRESREFRRLPFAVLRNLLAKHSFDRRYSDARMQSRIAILYAPLIRFAVEIINELQNVVQETKDGPGLRMLAKPFEARGSPTRTISPGLDPPLVEKLDSEEVRDFLISILYVIHRLPPRILNAIWLESDGSRALAILTLLEIAANLFSYQGREHAEAVTSKKQKPTLNILAHHSTRLNSIVDLNTSQFNDSKCEDSSSNNLSYPVLQLLNLTQEVAMIIIETLQTLSKFFVMKYSKALYHGEYNEIFAKLLSLHLEFLKENWPESIRLHAIATLAMFVKQYRSILFEGGPLDALSVLIEHVLVQMASRLPSIQSAAAGLLQLILRDGYETSETQLQIYAMDVSNLPSSAAVETRQLTPAERLGRPGAQTGVALARLLGTKLTIFPSSRFEKGMGALEMLVPTDSKRRTEFDKAVKELLKQLRGVMLATVALKDAEKDPIRLAELHIQLADSYRGSAALRSAWFDALANVHTNEKWHSEAAVCHMHSVAIIAKELAEKGELSFDWNIFDWISKEITDQEKRIGKERTVQPGGFTLDTLTQKIEQTAQSLTSAERYEAIGPLYRVILSALEKKCDFTSLVGIYHELQQSYSRAGEIKLSGKRHLGTYFRVRFIGKSFEQDSDTEWIYREAGLTSLAEASLRMKENCLNKNISNVQILSETEVNYINDRTGAFLQITHVDPYLEKGQKPKDFWSHTNLNKFVYETPVMEDKSSGSDSNVVGQALKRVTLEVSGQFPGSVRRMKVINRSEKIYSPLQFACQKLGMKAADIRAILAEPTEGRALDIKRLQLMLQGAVAATVNAGPLIYAEAFTHADQKKRYGDEGIKMLTNAFRDLMSACEAALIANKSAVGADQQTYHEMLATSFQGMHERLEIFFGASLRAPLEEEKKNYPRSTIHVLDSIGGINT